MPSPEKTDRLRVSEEAGSLRKEAGGADGLRKQEASVPDDLRRDSTAPSSLRKGSEGRAGTNEPDDAPTAPLRQKGAGDAYDEKAAAEVGAPAEGASRGGLTGDAPAGAPDGPGFSEVVKGQAKDSARGAARKAASLSVKRVSGAARLAARGSLTAPSRLRWAAGQIGNDAVGESANSTERAVDESVDRVTDELAPESLRRDYAAARGAAGKLPAQRATARLSRWDSRAAAHEAKALRAGERALRAEQRAEALVRDGMSKNSPLVRHEQRLAQRRWAAQRRRQAAAARLRGEGRGIRAAIMRARRAHAGGVSRAFGLKGAAIAVGAVIIFAALPVITSSCGSAVLMVMGGGGSNQSSGALTGVDAQVASALRALGFNNVQIAAVLGNLHAESNMDPTAEANFDGSSYPYERALGLFQFTDAGNGPDDLYAVANLTAFKNWCSDNSRSPYDAAAQVDYWATTYRSGWSTGLHRSGYYASAVPQYVGRDCSLSAWDTTDDVAFATYMFMACSGRPANWATRYDVRLQAAREAYAALISGNLGSGEEYAASSEAQKAVADAAKRTPATSGGYCAAWVSNVYQNAGFARPSGNANDMYYSWCHSSDRSELKVGMLVAVCPSAASGAGYTYGHVGVYVGDGYVMHSTEGRVFTDTLDDWIAKYGQYAQVRWGFPPGLSA